MGIRIHRSRVISISDGFPTATRTPSQLARQTPNTGSIQFETCEQGTYLPIFLPLPSGSLRGLRRIYILLGANRGAMRFPHGKRTSKNAEGAKSWPGLPETMDDLPSPVVPEILPNPFCTDWRVSTRTSAEGTSIWPLRSINPMRLPGSQPA